MSNDKVNKKDKANKLVTTIREVFASSKAAALEELLDEYNREPDKLFEDITSEAYGSAAYFWELCHLIRKDFIHTVKNVVANYYITQSEITAEDIFGYFQEKKLPRLILGFKKEFVHDEDFITYLLKIAKAKTLEFMKECKEKYRWDRTEHFCDVDEDTDEEVRKPNAANEASLRHAHFTPPEQKLVLQEEILILFSLLHSLGSRVENKLIYHCMVFLVSFYSKKGMNTLLELKGSELIHATVEIEEVYMHFFDTDKKYLEALKLQLERNNECSKAFISDIDLDSEAGRQTISNRVSDVKKRLKEVIEKRKFQDFFYSSDEKKRRDKDA